MASTTSLYKSPAAEQAVLDFCDSMLAHARHEIAVPTRFGETYLIASGEASAPPLILLHGAGTNATTWLGDIAMFSRAFRAYAVDIIGEPGRSAPSRPSYQGPAYADWLLDVFDALEIEQAASASVTYRYYR
jgi:pimeloyl-ACP methyl ester carboxylesterase